MLRVRIKPIVELLFAMKTKHSIDLNNKVIRQPAAYRLLLFFVGSSLFFVKFVQGKQV